MIELGLHLPLASFRLDLEVSLSESVTTVMGPSGSGKTSLLESLVGLRPWAVGRVVVDGEVLLDSARGVCVPPERRRVGYVPQDAGLFPHLNVLGNVRFGIRADPARLEAILDILEIRSLLERFPVSLSGGERQRVALGRALATAPRLLLLDEPLASLDVALRERIVPYLLRIRDEWGLPMIHVTHNVGEAVTLAREVLLLEQGRLAARGTPLALLSSRALARDAEAGIENLLPGRVVAHDETGGVTRVEIAGGLVVAAPVGSHRAPGARVTLAIRAEDILVLLQPVAGLSARNLYPARILGLERSGVDVVLRCSLVDTSPPWLVRLTPAAVEALGLAPGIGVWLAVKTHSVRL